MDKFKGILYDITSSSVIEISDFANVHKLIGNPLAFEETKDYFLMSAFGEQQVVVINNRWLAQTVLLGKSESGALRSLTPTEIEKFLGQTNLTLDEA